METPEAGGQRDGACPAYREAIARQGESGRAQAPIEVVGSYPDPNFTTAAGRKLDEILDTCDVPHDIKIYKGARHGFFNDQRPSAYNAEASADAWQRTLAFFREHIG